MKKCGPLPDPALLFHSLEKQARQYPVHTVRLTGKAGKLLGLTLLSGNLTTDDLQQATACLSAHLDQWPEKGRTTACRAPSRPADDTCQVTVEERAQLFTFLTRD